jgi:regulation of enolase protein 1 (concanavalin A-like superfamily)
VRQGYFPASTAEVGIMCAAPEGSGFDAEFDTISLSLAKKQAASNADYSCPAYGSRR